MKKTIILVLIVALGILMYATCPDREDHQEAIKTVVSNVLEEEISFLPSGLEKVVSGVGVPVAGTVMDILMKNKLKFKNYYLFSTSEVTYKGETKTVSFGILGHVFTFDEDDVRETVRNL